MEIRGIKYIAPLFDHSGYGQASRGYVLALHRLGIPITISPVSFEKTGPNLGENGRILNSLRDKNIDYNIVITHLTPEFWEKKSEPGKFNIGYTVWETSKLHPSWPGWINKMDMVMCSSEWNVEVFKNSGVTKPVVSIPHGIDLSEFDNIQEYQLAGPKSDAYKFYSIFQFTERKHPMALIKAYWHAFQNKENVALILKTYRGNFSDEEKDAIRSTVKKLKEVTPMDSYPPIYLILDLLSRDEILGLHKYGDCLVSLDRGEGFGLTAFEAGACSKPIIVTGMGGCLEYAKPNNSYQIGYSLTPVTGMPWSPWYRGDQLWAEPDLFDAAKTMRYIYAEQEEAKKTGIKLHDYIESNLTWDKVGTKLVDAIKSI
jgi:glycosyltransferase involved in cell wall biosynthesis